METIVNKSLGKINGPYTVVYNRQIVQMRNHVLLIVVIFACNKHTIC